MFSRSSSSNDLVVLKTNSISSRVYFAVDDEFTVSEADKLPIPVIRLISA